MTEPVNPMELQSHTGMPHYELQLNRVELQSHTLACTTTSYN